MRPPNLLAAALVALIAAPGTAQAGYTFCVASALGARDVWISEVFSAAQDRERLEESFKQTLTEAGAKRIVAQCPSPRDSKTDVINAQVAAEQFNRKLGAQIHAISAALFPPRR